jgi:hypothetical protein
MKQKRKRLIAHRNTKIHKDQKTFVLPICCHCSIICVLSIQMLRDIFGTSYSSSSSCRSVSPAFSCLCMNSVTPPHCYGGVYNEMVITEGGK